MNIAMSDAAAALLRALLMRTGVPRDRILLTQVHSVDWQSLTFIGERHEIAFRIPGPGSNVVAEQLCAGLENAEFAISGQIVADIAVRSMPKRTTDGATTMTIEALTIEE